MNVLESIYNEPEKWKQTKYTLRHECGCQVWTANLPILDTNMYPGTYLGFRGKVRLWWAVRWWAAHAPVEAFIE